MVNPNLGQSTYVSTDEDGNSQCRCDYREEQEHGLAGNGFENGRRRNVAQARVAKVLKG